MSSLYQARTMCASNLYQTASMYYPCCLYYPNLYRSSLCTSGQCVWVLHVLSSSSFPILASVFESQGIFTLSFLSCWFTLSYRDIKLNPQCISWVDSHLCLRLGKVVWEFINDDFCVYSSEQKHLSYLKLVFKACHDEGLFSNLQKSLFCTIIGVFLGHVISNYGIQIEQVKIEAIQKKSTQTCTHKRSKHARILKSSSSAVSTPGGEAEADLGSTCGGCDGASLHSGD